MSFIEELKRRKVFRVAASYAVVAFIIMQLVEILYPMFNFPAQNHDKMAFLHFLIIFSTLLPI